MSWLGSLVVSCPHLVREGQSTQRLTKKPPLILENYDCDSQGLLTRIIVVSGSSDAAYDHHLGVPGGLVHMGNIHDLSGRLCMPLGFLVFCASCCKYHLLPRLNSAFYL